MPLITNERYHDISCGHRVCGHETKCRFLHGHNYRITFTCRAEALDGLGRVIDFSAIKHTLCAWLEEHWDHKMLLWLQDPLLARMRALEQAGEDFAELAGIWGESVVAVPFNPTAENMASYLLTEIGPRLLAGGEVKLVRVRVEETRKCSATAE
jgi:6-pyruvoyltetrahydropterin/6-carboxytetrahydropterin synthase